MSALAAVISGLSPADRQLLAQRLAAARRQRDATRRFSLMYPDEGPLRRELYAKAVDFFAAGATHLERSLLGGNRVGKTSTAAFELTAHLTGKYPPWWRGRRFSRPVTAWAAGDDAKSVRESAQATLLGEPGRAGTGMIPLDAIVSMTRKAGVADAIDSAIVRHVSGGRSRLVFKAYDQRRESFQGAHVDVGWCDEEPPGPVYSEFLTRLMSTVPGEANGVMLATFTPLRGLSDVVLRFLPGGRPVEGNPRFVTFVSWDDVPHLSADEKAKLEEAYMPHEREARMKGVPSIGAGAIYPVPESDIVIKPIELPGWFRRVYALDVGWNRTAALWGAHDYETDILYLYSEHYSSHAEPAIHAQGVKARGEWVPGVIDPAARGRSQHDGARLLDIYRSLGLKLQIADNAVESGLYHVWERMSAGKLKIFENLQHTLTEFRIYRRDDKGRIVKERDHLMDCLRYLVISGMPIAESKPFDQLRDSDWPRGTRRATHEYEYQDPLYRESPRQPETTLPYRGRDAY